MLTDRFLGYINEQKLFAPTDCVLLAVSGGVDSVVMTDLFGAIHQPFAIAHVNFGLRGDESDADAVFVQNIADRYGVPFHLTRFDTATVAAERGISIQMAARELRYNWFTALLREHGYAWVATAHHQNDVFETLLLNLTRGTGLAGLHGILPRSGPVVRPLLFATRNDLAVYAQQTGLVHREDSSNAEDKYARNRIRHQVVPVLTDLNPGLLTDTLPRTVERLRAAEVLVQTELARSWHALVTKQNDAIFIPADALLTLPEPGFRLAEWLRPYGFGPEPVAQMLNALSRQSGQAFLSATHRITHERAGLLLEPLPVAADYELVLTEWPDTPIDVAGQFQLTVSCFDKPDDFRPPADAALACLDADRLTFPIIIRPWRQGDRFRPLGLSGTKLVSDLLNDLKISRSEREQTAVLLSGGDIAWVVGRRIGHRFRVTGETNRVCWLMKAD
ncbi:tRNA lysidine(34) synthetase TilS [Spirosoma montaniterrae]|uniref:tRNA(Ile)-lysidine synthase n=1 Tax=Spirosoma montaniterrae TaxID=1178516 RepID=A0A1P9WXA9_9BACT|nr:tRNA lysidine(34) synthetase TilS [Spirosoma montaniterrae]AQG79983.1 tRNA(Ile)-lysidine synthetase [Spirosoma montaniterrae]